MSEPELDLDVPSGATTGLSDLNALGIMHSEQHPLGYNPQIGNTVYDPALRDDRLEIKQKLASRFEHIYDKYGRDFDGVGDEIDLLTGEIVVDNGHIQSMQHEQDTIGKRAAETTDKPALDPVLGINDAIATRTGAEDSEDPSSDDDVLDSDYDTSFEVPGGKCAAGAEDAGSVTSPCEEDASAIENDMTLVRNNGPYFTGASTARPGVSRKRRRRATSSDSSDSSGEDRSYAPPGDVLAQIPGLQESILSLQSRYQRGENMDPTAVQALGMSIANQLASFIAQPGKGMSKRKSTYPFDASCAYPSISGKESRKRHMSHTLHAEFSEAPPSGKKSIWAPVRHPRQQTRKRMKEHAPVQELTTEHETDQDPEPSDDSDAFIPSERESITPNAKRTKRAIVRKCTHCGSVDSEVWRKGPNGNLCNTCGMYVYRYGLMRPLPESDDVAIREDTDGEMDPLEKDWWLASEAVHSTCAKEKVKPVGVKNSHFIPEEDALIIQLKEIDMVSWETMATFFPGRSAYALQCRYSKKLHGRAPEARQLLLKQGFLGEPNANGVLVFSYSRKPFTEQEDELLLKLRDEEGLEWTAVATSLPGRSPELLEDRYDQIVEQLVDGGAGELVQHTASRRGSMEAPTPPSHKNLRYSAEEDARIVKLREVDKLAWAEIAVALNSRNSFSLQKRYIRELCGRHADSVLPPRKAYDRSTLACDGDGPSGTESDQGSQAYRSSSEAPLPSAKWSAQEEALLLELRDSKHLDWAEIELHLPGRSLTALMKRYKTACNRTTPRAKLGVASDAGSHASERALPVPSYDADQSDMPEGQLTTTKSRQEQLFTDYEDQLIVKLRDVEGLPWSDIAAQLPNKTLSSISERYYRHLLRKKSQTSKIDSGNTGEDGEDVSNRAARVKSMGKATRQAVAKRWTKEEDELLLALRKQGKSWAEIGGHLPDRTSRAIMVHYSAIYDPTSKAYQQRNSLGIPTASIDHAPLLRRAVKNSRRKSETALSQDDEDIRPLDGMDEAAKARANSLGRTLVSKGSLTLERLDGTQSFGLKPTGVELTDLPAEMDLLIEGATQARPNDENALQTSSRPSSSAGGNGLSPTTPFHPAARMLPPFSTTTPVVSAMYATPARYNEQGQPYFIELSGNSLGPMSTPIVATDDTKSPKLAATNAISEQVAPVAVLDRKVVKRPATKRAPKSRKRKMRHHELDLDELSDEDVTKDDQVEELVLIDDATSADELYAADLPAPSRDVKASAIAKPVDEQPPDPSGCDGVDNNDSIAAKGGQSVITRQLIAQMLKSEAPRPVKAHEIIEYLKQNSNHFKEREGKGWHSGIQSILRRGPQFAKASRDGESGWILTETGVHAEGATSRAPTREGRPTIVREQNSCAGVNQHPQESVAINDASAEADSSELSMLGNSTRVFSSPLAKNAHTPLGTLATASTPATDETTLFSQTRKLRSSDRSTPIRAGSTVSRVTRGSSLARAVNGKRMVETPLREIGDSEDELAL